MNRYLMQTVFAASTLAICGLLPCAAQELQEGPVPTSAVIHVEGKGNAPVDASTLTLQVNGHATPIDSVRPVKPQGAEIAILIDEGLRHSFDTQISDLAKFVTELPPGARVLVGYMQNGTVRHEGGFTTNHAEAASQLRIPLSSAGMSASPYFCLSDFAKHWPSDQHAARFVLMITNGVDPYNGSTSIMNQDSPYVQEAQEDAQRAGVAVYPLYFGDVGFRGGRASFSGQSYLSQVAEATGGESLYTGTISPVNFTPYLNQFLGHIRESYVVGFKANGTHEKANTLTPIKVRSNNGVKVRAPEAVHPGNDEG